MIFHSHSFIRRVSLSCIVSEVREMQIVREIASCQCYCRMLCGIVLVLTISPSVVSYVMSINLKTSIFQVQSCQAVMKVLLSGCLNIGNSTSSSSPPAVGELL